MSRQNGFSIRWSHPIQPFLIATCPSLNFLGFFASISSLVSTCLPFYLILKYATNYLFYIRIIFSYSLSRHKEVHGQSQTCDVIKWRIIHIFFRGFHFHFSSYVPHFYDVKWLIFETLYPVTIKRKKRRVLDGKHRL